MGVIRLFLALTVLHQHAQFFPGPYWLPGYSAVCAFFIISGFYMALVLDTTYRAATLRFYANRALRLAPIYWTVLLFGILANEMGWLATVGCCNDIDNVLQPSRALGLHDRAIAIFANFTLFPSALYSSLTLFAADPWPWGSLMFGQMATVGLELLFYALAPLIALLRLRWLALLTLFALAAHFAPHIIGLPDRPWQYEFFPAILVYFLLGMMSYQLYKWLGGDHFRAPFGWLALPAILAYCIFVGGEQLGFTNSLRAWGLYLGLPLLMPFLFAASRQSRLDNVVGDFSYPVYVVHFLAIAWVASYGIADKLTRDHTALMMTLLLSAALYVIEVIIKPLRETVSGRKKPTVPGAGIRHAEPIAVEVGPAVRTHG
jgi:peptidoglycan/LPS O-acetylase OafA/YrhL